MAILNFIQYFFVCSFMVIRLIFVFSFRLNIIHKEI